MSQSESHEEAPHSFGHLVKAGRRELGLTQDELAHRVGCAPITLRKIEHDDFRPSVQIAERLAMALNVPLEERAAFVRLARTQREPEPLTPTPRPEEIGTEDLTGRAIRGYALAERLGTGGMAVVYRAVQPVVEREVAVKIILPQYANQPEFIRRFEAEAQIVARLEHPHIVPLYDYWREPNVACLVMRLLRGGSLRQLLEKGALPLDMVTRLLEHIGSALGVAHRAGVVDRDLKPANVMLDEDTNAYLADFGIAKNLSNPNLHDQTQADAIVGSPAYISPEQIRSEFVRPQTDIYALGVMLYELLTGTIPFSGPTPIEIMHQHLSTPLPPLAANRAGLPKAWDHIIAHATAKDPLERYADVESMLADIRSVADGQRLVVDKQLTPITPYKLLTSEDNPYKGLRAFGEGDAQDFFGRESLITQLMVRLSEGGDLSRFLAVIGPSGSGKSSVVGAGLVPALRRGGLPGSDQWFIVQLLPGPHPLEELEAALLRIAVNPPDSLLTQLREDKRGLLRAVRRCLPQDSNVELMLIIDQFEEVFTLVPDEAVRAHLLDSLVTAALDERGRVRVVVTLRADFLDRPLGYMDFGELLRQRMEVVLPLTPDELEHAIVGPAERIGLQLEPGLVSTIIRDVGDQPGTLPLLQYALTELFEKRADSTLTKATYQAIGGVLGALGRRAEEVFQGLSEPDQAAARQLFLRLVTLGEAVEDTRRRVLRSELEALNDASIQNPTSKIQNVLDVFGKHRLLTFDRDPITRGPTVEVAHEALLREWPRLREWLNESRADVRLQRKLAEEAAQWNGAQRDTSYLLIGAHLEQFEGWVLSTSIALTGDERAYLEASIAERERKQAEEMDREQRELDTVRKLAATETRRATEQARNARRFRWLAAGLAIFLLAAIGAAVLALLQSNIAQNNFVAAERTRLATQAQIALDNGEGGDLPALLALRSLKLGYSPEADAALINALQRGFALQRYVGHADGVETTDFSPDGRYVVTASDDHTTRLWDAQTGQEVRRLLGHTARVNAAIFSPDGRYVLTGSHDNTARLWNAETGVEVRQFTGHTGGVFGITFTPDGEQIITSDDTMARLWNVQTGKEVRQFLGHSDDVWWVDLSPDGRFLATFSVDKTARLWEVETGHELRRFEGHTDYIGGGSFSPDGRYLLTTSGDHTARLWDVETGRETHRFVGHTDALFDGRFSPDGRYILTTSFDKTARLWEVTSGQEVRQFLGHTDFVGTPAFSSDGRYILTGSGDRTARLWEVQPEIEPQTVASWTSATTIHASVIYAVTISPDSQEVLSSKTDGTIQLWDAQSGAAGPQIRFGAAPNNAQIMSSNNGLVLAGDNDGIARMADVHTGKVLRQFVGHVGPIWAIAFSPDNAYILTGGEDRTARLWDAETGQELRQFAGHTGPVRTVAFSPDGNNVVTGSDDGTARLWQTQTGTELQQWIGHTGPVLSVALSSDGHKALTGSGDGTARLWEIEKTGQEVRRFVGHTDQVTQVMFSPDGSYVLTGSADETARLWDVATGQAVRQFAGHSTPVQFINFSTDGEYVFTGDTRSALKWRAGLEEVIHFACTHISRDLTSEERALYKLTDTNTTTCPELAERMVKAEPTWTPVPPGRMSAASIAPSIEMEFVNEASNIAMGMPVQDVFIDAGNGQVVRPIILNSETLALPVYRSAIEVPLDFLEAPFDTGPYPKGEPLGFTLGDYVAATGRGTYTVHGDRALVDLTFDRLVPNGLYTMWCLPWSLTKGTMTETPCLASDGSAYHFTADENGHAQISMDIKAIPPSTQDAFYEISAAYHSDGLGRGYYVGKHGHNVHGQVWYDFLPPEGLQPAIATPSLAAEDEGSVAREWMSLLAERVQAEFLPPTTAARIYAYAGLTLYEAVVPGAPNLKSLQGQLNDLPELPRPGDGLYNWPAVADSAVSTAAKALFESPRSWAVIDQLRDQQLAALQMSGVTTDILNRSMAHGQRLGQAIVAWMEADRYRELRNKPFAPPTGPGYWMPPSSSRKKPTTPYWGDLRPFALTTADACKPPDPVSYSEDPSSAFYAQAREVYDASQTLTAEQKAMALFWADMPGMTGTPPGHWVSIVNQLSEEQHLSLERTAELHALVGFGLADAFISTWKEKYEVSLIRPESYIQQQLDPDWQPLIATPPFPEYPSGHSVASAAAAEILTEIRGTMPFTDTTHEGRGLGVRRFASFIDAAKEAALSRLYGGIHYRMAIENGLAQGQCVGRNVLERVQTH
jgi:WD40 repeat protein/serine/threonine protein kinase/DNA-binding XRE family transcriptional regulator